MVEIVFVISSHGLGHLTRQIALKDALLDIDPDLNVVFVISEIQKEFLSNAILTSPNVRIEEIPLTPKLTMDTWLDVDVESTYESFLRFWEWETQIRDDAEWGRLLRHADLVINDAECVHNPIASKMGKIIVTITNFPWSDILQGMGFEELALNYSIWERLSTHFVKLPFATNWWHHPVVIEKGMLARVTDINREPARRRVFLNIPPSIDLNLNLLIKELISKGLEIYVNERTIINEPVPKEAIIIAKNDPNTNQYIASSNLVVSKLGYGIVSEISSSGIPILFWSRPSFIEDEVLAHSIVSNRRGAAIPAEVSIHEMIDLIENWIDQSFNPIPIANREIAEFILSLIER
ncbi:MAG: hypothetical protein ACXAE3_16010 [Candidatus Kariarchaeaceae archaeon]